MSPKDLRDEVEIEFNSLRQTLAELDSLRQDVEGRQPTIRELAAAGLFLANVYNGIENVLKRVCRYFQVPIPSGADWHVELAAKFRNPPQENLPMLLDDRLADALAPFRQFRHVVHHGYGLELRWADMLPGVETAAEVFGRFQAAVEPFLAELDRDDATDKDGGGG